MNISVDNDKRVDEPSRAFQRSVPGVVSVVRVLCAVLCTVLGVLYVPYCVLRELCDV